MRHSRLECSPGGLTDSVTVTVATQERFEGFDDDADNAIGTRVTCFTRTKVQRLTQSSMWPQAWQISQGQQEYFFQRSMRQLSKNGFKLTTPRK